MQNETGGPATSRPQKLNNDSTATVSRKNGKRSGQVHFGPRLLDLDRSSNYLRALSATCLHAADSKRPKEILAAFTILRTMRLGAARAWGPEGGGLLPATRKLQGGSVVRRVEDYRHSGRQLHHQLQGRGGGLRSFGAANSRCF